SICTEFFSWVGTVFHGELGIYFWKDLGGRLGVLIFATALLKNGRWVVVEGVGSSQKISNLRQRFIWLVISGLLIFATAF
ncbi:hypothetical protein, partial [Flavisolibacter nicotianae]|uniref:hypothetical protein n=1 Tax=Flavisolibacter nicotianae TaxID=2364882 RepID=UPI0019699444